MPAVMPAPSCPVEYWYGEQEKMARRADIAYIRRIFPETKSVENKEQDHAEFFTLHPEAFCRQLITFIQREKRKMMEKRRKTMYLEIKDLKKSYGEGSSYAQVLRGVTTGVEAGQICAILGPSGSGKSTLLNCVGGLETADSGSIRVDGSDICRLKPGELAEYRREKLGFVFQFYNLVPNLTVRENIQVCQYLTASPLPLDELLETLGLTEHQRKFPAQLSGGQQQRCAIARALIKKPQLLLCDEPTGALDSASSREILQLLEQVNRQYETTILLVTHNSAIRLMAHKVLQIRDGRIVEEYENASPVSASELEEL